MPEFAVHSTAVGIPKRSRGFGSSQGPPRLWGSGRQGQTGDEVGFRFGLEQLSEPGAELAVDDSASDLEQAIGAAAGPAHLLLLVHASVDQEVGSTFDDRGADPQAGAMTL